MATEPIVLAQKETHVARAAVGSCQTTIGFHKKKQLLIAEELRDLLGLNSAILKNTWVSPCIHIN